MPPSPKGSPQAGAPELENPSPTGQSRLETTPAGLGTQTTYLQQQEAPDAHEDYDLSPRAGKASRGPQLRAAAAGVNRKWRAAPGPAPGLTSVVLQGALAGQPLAEKAGSCGSPTALLAHQGSWADSTVGKSGEKTASQGRALVKTGKRQQEPEQKTKGDSRARKEGKVRPSLGPRPLSVGFGKSLWPIPMSPLNP